MEKIPNDGSYFQGGIGVCSKGSKGCAPTHTSGYAIVRRLRLDKNPEGASVFFCKYHWEAEMRHRQWMNEHGLAHPFDVFDFFEDDPGLTEYIKQPEEAADETPPKFPVLSFSTEKAGMFDVHTARLTNKGSYASTRYTFRDRRELALASSIQSAQNSLSSLSDMTEIRVGLIAIFDSTDSIDEVVERNRFIESVLEVIQDEWGGFVKYG